MPATAQQNDSYTENRDQLERARIQPVATPNKDATNTSKYRTTQPYTENRAQLENARMKSLGESNKKASNDPEYGTTQPSSAKVISFPTRSSHQQTNTPLEQVSFFSFAPAFLTALLKDFLDFAFITSMPGIGTLLTGCFIILIALFIFFFPKRRYHTMGNTSLAIKEISLLLSIAAFEGLAFPINLLPATAGIVYAIYRLEKAEVEKRNTQKNEDSTTKVRDFAAWRSQKTTRG